jgi:hypothetical protein
MTARQQYRIRNLSETDLAFAIKLHILRLHWVWPAFLCIEAAGRGGRGGWFVASDRIAACTETVGGYAVCGFSAGAEGGIAGG